ncbi:MAG: hypothetical protein ABI876_12830 [Bacteroidota bacterium]
MPYISNQRINRRDSIHVRLALRPEKDAPLSVKTDSKISDRIAIDIAECADTIADPISHGSPHPPNLVKTLRGGIGSHLVRLCMDRRIDHRQHPEAE